MDVKVIVEDVSVHPHTGYVTYTVFTKTTDGEKTWEGPRKQYGTDAQALRDRFNSSLEEFEAWVAKEHKSLHGVHHEFVGKILERKGKVIG